jgi:hypothetical protein
MFLGYLYVSNYMHTHAHQNELMLLSYFPVLRVQSQALHMQGKPSTTEPQSLPPLWFLIMCFKIYHAYLSISIYIHHYHF